MVSRHRLMSRDGSSWHMETGVMTHFLGRDLGSFCGAEGRSRHGIDVATWLSCPGGRDLEMMSRPGQGLGKGRRSRHAPTTWALCA